MKTYSVAIIALMLLAVSFERAPLQNPPRDHSFHLRFPESIETTDLAIHYYLTGPFGGYRSFVRTKPQTLDYAIDTIYEGKPAKSLKAIVYRPGYSMVLLNVPSLDDLAVRTADIKLERLASIPLSDKMVIPERRNVEDFKIEIFYVAFWSNQFYGVMDGAVSTFKVASADMAQDGSFSVMVPDFANDPVVGSFKEKGQLKIIVRESQTGNILYTSERRI